MGPKNPSLKHSVQYVKALSLTQQNSYHRTCRACSPFVTVSHKTLEGIETEERDELVKTFSNLLGRLPQKKCLFSASDAMKFMCNLGSGWVYSQIILQITTQWHFNNFAYRVTVIGGKSIAIAFSLMSLSPPDHFHTKK